MITIKIEGRPVSVNHLYSSARSGRRRITAKGWAWKDTVCYIAKQALEKPCTGPVILEITYIFPDNRRRDVTNYDKAILDALKGVAYDDDNQIVSIAIHKFVKPSDNFEGVTMITIYDLTEKGEFNNAWNSFKYTIIDHISFHPDVCLPDTNTE